MPYLHWIFRQNVMSCKLNTSKHKVKVPGWILQRMYQSELLSNHKSQFSSCLLCFHLKLSLSDIRNVLTQQQHSELYCCPSRRSRTSSSVLIESIKQDNKNNIFMAHDWRLAIGDWRLATGDWRRVIDHVRLGTSSSQREIWPVKGWLFETKKLLLPYVPLMLGNRG